ncbi:toxic anion resistance protein [Anaeromassilibacillus sp. SJQ-5]
MADELMNLPPADAAPVLTLDPMTTQAPVMAELAPKPEEIPEDLSENNLTPEEKKMVEDFAKTIDVTNSNVILTYGAAAQQKIAGFSESALKSVRTKDMGEIGEMVSNLVTELRAFSPEEESKGGFFSLFKKPANKIAAMKSKYDKAETSVDKICAQLEAHQIQLMKDVAMLDQMYQVNLNYFKELSMYILAGKRRLNEVRTTILPELMEKARQSGLPEDAQAANDMDALCNRFEKKIHDLELTRVISIQMAPQIRLVQGNDTLMTEKIQSTIVNTIPLWKSQMVLALGLSHSLDAMEAQRKVTDLTNDLLKKNADALKTATVETAKESERGIVDIETLQHTNESLISTLDEVMRIQEEGRQKRRDAEAELGRMEGELKQKLLELRK